MPPPDEARAKVHPPTGSFKATQAVPIGKTTIALSFYLDELTHESQQLSLFHQSQRVAIPQTIRPYRPHRQLCIKIDL